MLPNGLLLIISVWLRLWYIMKIMTVGTATIPGKAPGNSGIILTVWKLFFSSDGTVYFRKRTIVIY